MAIWGSLAWRGTPEQSNAAYQYLDGSFTQKAMLRTELTSAEVALKITPEVQAPATARQTLRFENAVLNPNDRNDTVVDVGARWDSSLGSVSRTDWLDPQTHFLNRSDTQIALLDGYRDRELYLSTDWQYSVMSRVGGGSDTCTETIPFWAPAISGAECQSYLQHTTTHR